MKFIRNKKDQNLSTHGHGEKQKAVVLSLGFSSEPLCLCVEWFVFSLK